jgi:hypothetical protein
MASKTSRTEHKRIRVKRTGGKKRKAADRTNGSTKSQKELFKD